MIIRTKKAVPLYEKFDLFTEAKKKKKRVVTVTTSRAKDYTSMVDPEDEQLDFGDLSGISDADLNNIPTDDDDDSDMLVDNLDDIISNMEGELNSEQLQTDAQAGTEPISDGQNDDQTGSAVTGDASGTDSTAPAPDAGGDVTTQQPDVPEGTPSDAQTGAEDTTGAGGDDPTTQDQTDPTAATTDQPGDGVEPQADQDATGTGANELDGTGGAAGQDQTNPDGTGDVAQPVPTDAATTPAPDAQTPPTDPNATPDATAATDPNADPNTAAGGNDVVEIEDPANTGDDLTAGVDDGDPNAAATDPNAMGADPNAAAGADPNASMAADMQAFDKSDMRKYQLFKRFIDLHDVTLRFVRTLEAVIVDNADYGVIVVNTTKKLKDVEGILKDYMILKFQSDSYLQNSFFFEKSKTAVMLALELLKVGKKQVDDAKH